VEGTVKRLPRGARRLAQLTLAMALGHFHGYSCNQNSLRRQIRAPSYWKLGKSPIIRESGLFGDELTPILLTSMIGCICVAKGALSGLASRFKQLYIKPP
jgi:hypothetical protein